MQWEITNGVKWMRCSALTASRRLGTRFMTTQQTGEVIFADARQLHSAALERLCAGDLRDAAEKAWCAVKRATDALILVRTGHAPKTTTETAQGLRQLDEVDPEVKKLSMRARYYSAQRSLHGDCFYSGNCDPEKHPDHIRRVVEYVGHAEKLAF